VSLPTAPEEASPGPSRRLRLAGIAISAISIVGVVWWATTQPAPVLPSGVGEWSALIAAIAIYGLATLVRGERWLSLLRRSGARPSRADAQALTVVGFMGNNVFPARGGDAMRVVLMAPRSDTSMRTVIGTLVAERLLDVVVLFGLFVLLAYVVLGDVDAPSAARLAIVAGVAVLLVALVVIFLTAGRRHPRIRRLVDYVAPITVATRELRGSYGASMVLLTIAIWALETGTYWAVAASVGLDINPLEAAYLVALASIFVIIPAGPGYIGTLDAAIVFGVSAIGGSGSETVSFLLALRFVLLVPITLLGLVLLVTRYGGLGGTARAEAPGR
jgi:glycosyltransferase 2 family protein